MSYTRTIVIVGAGFCGTAVAVHLLRQSRGPLTIKLVDSGRIGRGAAYLDGDRSLLLNVPAGRMSAVSAEPADFLEFVRQRQPAAGAEDFLPRAVYGDYLEALLARAESSATRGVHLERIHARAEELDQHRLRYYLRLESGVALAADEVVLALGNPPPPPLPGSELLRASGRYIDDPWRGGASVSKSETVLIVGTGLTMADVVLAGSRNSRGKARFIALSRHGLLPLPQAVLQGASCTADQPALLDAAEHSTRRLVRTVRDLAERHQAAGLDWRDAITCVRNLAPRLWQRMPEHSRRQFLRHGRAYWEVHRHRLPEGMFAALRRLEGTGHLAVHAGRVSRLGLHAGRVRVHWQPRGSGSSIVQDVDRVINCTGPDYNLYRSQDLLLKSILRQGLALPDRLGLGVHTDEIGRLRDRHGRPVSSLYYVGPMLRADNWEATAVPELRAHTERLASHLAQDEVSQVAS
jgi:uncharacterized NAD(P)/FAD-binding protein YdhS